MGPTFLKFYVAFFVAAYFPTSLSLYEFICTEKGLFTPYLNIYQGRSGPKIFTAGPGFYDMRDHYDIYICINGPAYLYFSHNTTLGEVFETPKFDVFAHKCGIYNKGEHNHTHLPKENFTVLNGLLLMGDPTDYRLPSIQLFTAPHVNGTGTVIVNGTSIMTFGNTDCMIEKGGVEIKIKSKDAADPAKPEYCMRPFLPTGTPTEEDVLLTATAPISPKGCSPRVVGGGGSGGPPGPCVGTTAAGAGGCTCATPTPATCNKGDKCTPTGCSARRRKRAAADCTPGSATTADCTCKSASGTATETCKNGQTCETAGTCSGTPTTPTGGGSANATATGATKEILANDCKPLPLLADECKEGKPDPDHACKLFDVMTGAQQNPWDAGNVWRRDLIQLIGEIYVQACPLIETRFVKLITNLAGLYLLEGMGISAAPTTTNTTSTTPPPTGRRKRTALPPCTGPSVPTDCDCEGKGKCNPPETCDIPSKSCKNPAVTTPVVATATSATPGVIVSVPVGRRNVWNFITEALESCKKRKVRLEFTETKDGEKVLRRYVKQGNHPIHHLIEEADNDYSFNWVIEAHWRMFATVLGVCTPKSRVKQSVITSKLYTTYTEDFLKHMTPEWIRSKDNLIFQFILGDFYTIETESKLDDYLEAAFISSKSESYRPLRPLLVSDIKEDNFFRNNLALPLQSYPLSDPVRPPASAPLPPSSPIHDSSSDTNTNNVIDDDEGPPPSMNSIDDQPEPRNRVNPPPLPPPSYHENESPHIQNPPPADHKNEVHIPFTDKEPPRESQSHPPNIIKEPPTYHKPPSSYDDFEPNPPKIIKEPPTYSKNEPYSSYSKSDPSEIIKEPPPTFRKNEPHPYIEREPPPSYRDFEPNPPKIVKEPPPPFAKKELHIPYVVKEPQSPDDNSKPKPPHVSANDHFEDPYNPDTIEQRSKPIPIRPNPSSGSGFDSDSDEPTNIHSDFPEPPSSLSGHSNIHGDSSAETLPQHQPQYQSSPSGHTYIHTDFSSKPKPSSAGHTYVHTFDQQPPNSNPNPRPNKPLIFNPLPPPKPQQPKKPPPRPTQYVLDISRLGDAPGEDEPGSLDLS